MKLINKLQTLSLIIVLCSLTSCIELYENVYFNKNNSGTATISAAYTSENSPLKKTGQLIRHYPPIDSLKNLKGISNIKFTNSTDSASISFKFKNVESLNKAMQFIYWAKQHKSKEYTYILNKKNKINRTIMTFFVGWDGQYNHYVNALVKGYPTDKQTWNEVYQCQQLKIHYNYNFKKPIDVKKLNHISKVTNKNKTVIWTVDHPIILNHVEYMANSFFKK